MSGNRCPAREEQTLQLLRTAGDMNAHQLAQALGVRPATAGQYLQQLKRDGLASNSGLGCKAMWSAKPPEPKAPPAAIVQCASVWEYAARMA